MTHRAETHQSRLPISNRLRRSLGRGGSHASPIDGSNIRGFARRTDRVRSVQQCVSASAGLVLNKLHRGDEGLMEHKAVGGVEDSSGPNLQCDLSVLLCGSTLTRTSMVLDPLFKGCNTSGQELPCDKGQRCTSNTLSFLLRLPCLLSPFGRY